MKAILYGHVLNLNMKLNYSYVYTPYRVSQQTLQLSLDNNLLCQKFLYHQIITLNKYIHLYLGDNHQLNFRMQIYKKIKSQLTKDYQIQGNK